MGGESFHPCGGLFATKTLLTNKSNMLLAILIINILILVIVWGRGHVMGNISDQLIEMDLKLDDLQKKSEDPYHYKSKVTEYDV
jgi:hypothetical protein